MGRESGAVGLRRFLKLESPGVTLSKTEMRPLIFNAPDFSFRFALV